MDNERKIKWIYIWRDSSRAWVNEYTHEELKQLKERLKIYPGGDLYEVRWKCDIEAVLDYGTIDLE